MSHKHLLSAPKKLDKVKHFIAFDRNTFKLSQSDAKLRNEPELIA